MIGLAEPFRSVLAAIGRTHMPFGKPGPQHLRPNGMPLWEVPTEYLGWFASKAQFPKGRLSALPRMVHQVKGDGSDIVRVSGVKASLAPGASLVKVKDHRSPLG